MSPNGKSLPRGIGHPGCDNRLLVTTQKGGAAPLS